MSARRPVRAVLLAAALTLLFLPAGARAAPIALGVFVPNVFEHPEVISAYGRKVGRQPAVVLSYKNWSIEPFYAPELQNVWDRGAVPMVTWEPQTADETYRSRPHPTNRRARLTSADRFCLPRTRKRVRRNGAGARAALAGGPQISRRAEWISPRTVRGRHVVGWRHAGSERPPGSYSGPGLPRCSHDRPVSSPGRLARRRDRLQHGRIGCACVPGGLDRPRRDDSPPHGVASIRNRTRRNLRGGATLLEPATR